MRSAALAPVGLGLLLVAACGTPPTSRGAETPSRVRAAPAAVLHAKAITVGAEHACALTSDAKVLCWGANDQGQLGDGTNARRSTPRPVEGLPPIEEIAAGARHTCARANDGGVWCWGSNSRGELGDGSMDAHAKPVRVTNLLAAASIAAGGHRTCARNASDHFVVCWGELTDGTAERSPMPVFGMTATEQIAVGALHACARVEGDDAIAHVRCWGENTVRQLGVPHVDDKGLPVDVPDLEKGAVQIALGREHSCARTPDGAAVCWGGGLRCVPGEWFEGKRVAVRPGKIPGFEGATWLAAGGDAACIVKQDGTVACARPRGPSGGDPKQRACVSDAVAGLSDVADVAIGDTFACARTKKDGTVMCWSDGVAPAPILL